MSSNIAPLGPSLTSQARAAELNAANAARARIMSGELGDISELPSAQPVSLGDFAIRSSTNNKGSKFWKPFPLDDGTNEQISGNGEAFRRPHRPVDRYFPPNASPSPAYPQSHLRSSPVPYYGSYQFPDYQYPMYQGMNYYQQMYPGQMGYYPMMSAFPTNYAMMRTPSPVKSPRRRLHNRSRNRIARHDMSPTKQQEEMIHPKPAVHEVVKKQDDEQQMKETKNSEFEESFRNMPLNNKQHEHQDPPSTPEQVICHLKQEIPVKHQPQTPRHDKMLGSPEMDFQGSDDAEEKFHTPSQRVSPSPSSGSEFSCHSILKSNSATFAARQRQFSFTRANILPEKTSEDHLSFSKTGDADSLMTTAKLVHIGLPIVGNDCKNISTAKEYFSLDDAETREESVDLNVLLNGVQETSHLEKDIFDLEDPFVPEQKGGILRKSQSSYQQRDPSSVKTYVPLVNKYEKDVFASEESREKELAKISTEATWKEFQQGPKRIKVPGSRFAYLFEEDPLTKKKGVKNDISRRSRPPPGLDFSGFGSPVPWVSSASNTSVYYERVLEAEDWFHQGNNLKDDLPLEFGQRLGHELAKVLNAKKEARTAVQAFDPFKRVVANLYSYSPTYNNGKRTCKSLGFANLGPVSEHCCEPRYGGRRSFFDNDPCARQWRLQTTLFAPEFRLSAQRQSILTRNHSSSSFSLS